MKKLLIFEKRKKAKELRAKNWSIRKIAQALVASKSNVSKWLKMEGAALEGDLRGWQKGRMRSHTEEEVERIIELRKELEKEESYFIGDKVVQQNYWQRYGEKIKLWFVKKVLKEQNMVKSPVNKKGKGRSRYMQYPEQLLRKTGKSVMSIDFIGPKYLKGSNRRINFLSCKYIRPVQTGILKRVEGQTTSETIKMLKQVWQEHPIPDVVKMDNDSAFGGTLTHKRYLGKLSIMLLNLGVTPLYIAPRSPWNNGHGESFNSIFAKKFWNRIRFTDEDELGIKIEKFNMEYQKYTDLVGNNLPVEGPRYLTGEEADAELFNTSLEGLKAYKVIFLRIVRRKGEKQSKNEEGFIDILGENIKINKSFINLFTWCELDIKAKKLYIYVEEENGSATLIKTVKYQPSNIKYRDG